MDDMKNQRCDEFESDAERAAETARAIARVMEIARRVSAKPILDPRSPDEIIGYDEHGVPR